MNSRLCFIGCAAVLMAATPGSPAGAQFGPSFVKVTTAPTAGVSAGKPFNIKVTITIDKPYHIQANPPSKDMIATEVTAGPVKGLAPGKAAYPKGMDLVIAGDRLSVYQGVVTVNLPVTADKTLKPGEYHLPISVRYQGCNERSCFPPTTLKAEAIVKVGGAAHAKPESVRKS